MILKTADVRFQDCFLEETFSQCAFQLKFIAELINMIMGFNFLECELSFHKLTAFILSC